ncbi:MAG TPA: cytochrome c [Myxococcota bacterium]|jgi:hypothetical protein
MSIALASILSFVASAHVIVDVSDVPAPAAATAPATDAAAMTTAKQLYGTRCAMCHGATGQGDGPSAMGLPVKPRRQSDSLWQASVTDDDIAAVILGGGAARKLSIIMPAAADLKDKPDVVKALVAHIRSLRAAHGTVRATLTSTTAPKPIVATGDAGADAVAHVDVGDVAAGTYAVKVEAAPGVVLCTASAVVAAVDVHVPCAPAPKKAP